MSAQERLREVHGRRRPYGSSPRRQDAQGDPDPDIALHSFVTPAGRAGAGTTWSSTAPHGPRHTDHRRIRTVALTVSDGGKGLLQGRLTVDGGDWLRSRSASAIEVRLNGSRTAGRTAYRTRSLARQGTAPNSPSSPMAASRAAGQLDVGAIPFRGRRSRAPAVSRLAERYGSGPSRRSPCWRMATSPSGSRPTVGPIPWRGQPPRVSPARCSSSSRAWASRPDRMAPVESEYHYTLVPPEVATGQVFRAGLVKKWIYATADSNRHWLRLAAASVSRLAAGRPRLRD